MREIDRIPDYLVSGIARQEDEEGREAEKGESALWRHVNVEGVPVIVRTAISGVPVTIRTTVRKAKNV